MKEVFKADIFQRHPVWAEFFRKWSNPSRRRARLRAEMSSRTFAMPILGSSMLSQRRFDGRFMTAIRAVGLIYALHLCATDLFS